MTQRDFFGKQAQRQKRAVLARKLLEAAKLLALRSVEVAAWNMRNLPPIEKLHALVVTDDLDGFSRLNSAFYSQDAIRDRLAAADAKLREISRDLAVCRDLLNAGEAVLGHRGGDAHVLLLHGEELQADAIATGETAFDTCSRVRKSMEKAVALLGEYGDLALACSRRLEGKQQSFAEQPHPRTQGGE